MVRCGNLFQASKYIWKIYLIPFIFTYVYNLSYHTGIMLSQLNTMLSNLLCDLHKLFVPYIRFSNKLSAQTMPLTLSQTFTNV
jgi:hypothetical protein